MVYNYFVLITFIANLLVAFFIFFNNPKREINRILTLFSLIVSLWTFIIFIARFFDNTNIIIILAKINFIFMTLNLYLFLHFVEILPNSSIKNKKYLFYFMIPIPIIWLVILSPYFITGAQYAPAKINLQRGLLYPLWVLYFISYIMITIYKLFLKYKDKQGLLKLQIKYILLGFFILAAGSFTTNLLLPLLKINTFTNYGPLFTLPFISLLGYSIIKYRLLDIVILIRRSLVYFVLVTFISSIYISSILVLQIFFVKSHLSVSIFFSILSAFIIAVSLEPLKNKIGALTDKIFFKGKYDYYKVLKSLIHDLSTIVKMEELLNKVVYTITSAMRLNYTAVFIFEKNTSTFVLNKKTNSKELEIGFLQINDPLVGYLLEKNEVLVRDELEYIINDEKLCSDIRGTFERLKAEVFIPLILKKKLIGLLVLGSRKSDDIFTQEDLDLLTMISYQISVVLENTNLYEQMLNTAKLALVGTMAAGMSHEIRNPLSIMKMYVQMLPAKYTDKKFVDETYEVLTEEINRLSRLTEDLLSFAKPKPPNLELLDVNVSLSKVKKLFENKIERHRIKIVEIYNKVPLVFADKSQLEQVFMNIFLNSIQSIRNSNGIITLETKADTDGDLLKYTTISVLDNGEGIAEQNLNRLFEPFYTTKKEGTGLGLAICLKIIQEHNGFIKVKSILNEGTSFKIFLPSYDAK